MGIRGAWSLMDDDLTRHKYIETFELCGPIIEEGQVALLVDGMSLLYHVAVKPVAIVHAQPGTIYSLVTVFIQQLLAAVGNKGSVQVFLDGLPPRAKVSSQVKRMSEQCATGDMLAQKKNSTDIKTKLMHHLADWALVEAVQDLMNEHESSLFLHRPSIGEAEAHINQWIVQNSSAYSKIGIISDDTDFLVYESCPGFIPPSSITFERHGENLILRGKHYLRSKFISSFLLEETKDLRVMTSVAAIAGCDYTLDRDKESKLAQLRNAIVAKHQGSLPADERKSSAKHFFATKVLAAVLQVIYSFKKKDPETWLHKLVNHFSYPDALDAIRSIHEIYLYTLQISSYPRLDINSGMVCVRRLLQYGIFFCPPLMESWEQITRDSNAKISAVSSYALLPSPPLATQIEVWMSRYSIWMFPHFRQIRARLYGLIRLAAVHNQWPSEIQLNSSWLGEPVISEVARLSGSGAKDMKMHILQTDAPDPLDMSYGFNGHDLLRNDVAAIDRALIYCLLGSTIQCRACKQPEAMNEGLLFLSSIMLPFNMAALLILLAKAPPDLSTVEFPDLTATDACNEVTEILPFLSVACAHAFLLVDTISVLKEKNLHLESSLAKGQLSVSKTFRLDTALIVWHCIRNGRNLEYLEDEVKFRAVDQANIEGYMEDAFTNMENLSLSKSTSLHHLLVSWKTSALSAWKLYWDLFNLEEEDEYFLPKRPKTKHDSGPKDISYKKKIF